MVVTQWAFVGPALLWPDKLGISISSQETEEVRYTRDIYDDSIGVIVLLPQGLEGLVHVMYLVGRELGIREELNMCSGDLNEVREVAREILVTEIQVSVTQDILCISI